MVVNDSNLVPKSSKTFVCEKCDFNCSRLSQYNRHLMTRKHIMDSKMIVNDSKLVPNSSNKFECECGKFYSSRQTLYVHKKKCNTKLEDVCESKSEKSNEALILKLLAQNALLQNSLLEMIPKLGTTNINNGIMTPLRVRHL